MGMRDQQVFDEILVLYRGCCLAAATTALGLIGVQRLSLGVALMGNRHHQVFFIDKVRVGQIELATDYISASLVAICTSYLFKLPTHDGNQAFV